MCEGITREGEPCQQRYYLGSDEHGNIMCRHHKGEETYASARAKSHRKIENYIRGLSARLDIAFKKANPDWNNRQGLNATTGKSPFGTDVIIGKTETIFKSPFEPTSFGSSSIPFGMDADSKRPSCVQKRERCPPNIVEPVHKRARYAEPDHHIDFFADPFRPLLRS
jgi:hypothetical protein